MQEDYEVRGLWSIYLYHLRTKVLNPPNITGVAAIL
jgi:hypothetical protein